MGEEGEGNGLSRCLREVFGAVNDELRWVTSETLDRCADRVLDGMGVDWLLETARTLNEVDIDQVRQNAQSYRAFMSSEGGKAALKEYLGRHQDEVIAWRRRIVAHTRVWQPRDPGLHLQCQDMARASQVYDILMGKPEGERA